SSAATALADPAATVRRSAATRATDRTARAADLALRTAATGAARPAAARSADAAAVARAPATAAPVPPRPLVVARRGRPGPGRPRRRPGGRLPGAVGGALSLEAMLGQSPATVRASYEGRRKADQAATALIDVPELGTAAYWYLAVRLGTELVAYDGNLYFRVLWGDLRTPSKTAP